jgi:hypothetical protein
MNGSFLVWRACYIYKSLLSEYELGLSVGLTSKSGGLEAYKEFFHALPVDTGMAFVLIQHLDPSHHSLLAEILSKATKLPVNEVKSGIRIKTKSWVRDTPGKYRARSMGGEWDHKPAWWFNPYAQRCASRQERNFLFDFSSYKTPGQAIAAAPQIVLHNYYCGITARKHGLHQTRAC